MKNPKLKRFFYSVGKSLKDLDGAALAPGNDTAAKADEAKSNPWRGDNAVFTIWE